MRCHGFPGPGYEARILVNPMKEYIHPVDDSHVHHMHKDFRKKYNKKDETNHAEFFKRKHIFKHNLRYMISLNTSYVLSFVNLFTVFSVAQAHMHTYAHAHMHIHK